MARGAFRHKVAYELIPLSLLDREAVGNGIRAIRKLALKRGMATSRKSGSGKLGDHLDVAYRENDRPRIGHERLSDPRSASAAGQSTRCRSEAEWRDDAAQKRTHLEDTGTRTVIALTADPLLA